MQLQRRQFIQLLAGAGLSAFASSWLVDRVLALSDAGELPVAPGPGIESWVATACGFCSGGCGLAIRRIDGLPVGIRGHTGHLVNRGKLCSLGHAGIQALFSSDRLRRPIKRSGRRGQGTWTEILWAEAASIIQERLQALIAAGSRDRVVFLDGHRPGVGRMVAQGFMRGVGSQHYITPAGSTAHELAREMFGWERPPGADLEGAAVVVLFRFDHLETDGSPVWQNGVYGRSRDATGGRPIYISVGPRPLGSAAKSDFWLPARPGTEGIVALAMTHVILRNGWQNPKFLERFTDWRELTSSGEQPGFRLLTAITPAVASQVTGVPAARITNAARQFVDHQPGVALAGPGTLANPSGRLMLWAVNLLNVLVGAVGGRGGLVPLAAPRFADVWKEKETSSEATSLQPVIASPAQLAHALITSKPLPIDLLFIRDANPAFDSPLARAFRRGLLSSNDRMVVAFATELNETAKLADLVLPEPTFLERWDMLTDTPIVPRAHASLQQPVIPRLFSSRQSEEVLASINNALGEVSRVTFQVTKAEDLVRQASRGLFRDQRGGIYRAGMSPAQVKKPKSFSGFWQEFQATTVWAFSENSLRPTSSQRKFTVLPRRFLHFEGKGKSVPHEVSRLAMPVSLGDQTRYPYELVVFRTGQLRDGETANVPMMMELCGHWPGLMWSTWVEMHPRTAGAAAVSNGDMVRIVSELGHIEAVAHVSSATPPGLLAVPLGLGHETGSTAAGIGANVNLILASELDVPRSILAERVTRARLVKI
ncbi:MAG: molybdopterin-dependent oxidoreductase [Candidatus Binatia bacterium]